MIAMLIYWPTTALKKSQYDHVSNHVWQISDLLLEYISALRYAHGSDVLNEITQISTKFYEFQTDVDFSDGCDVGVGTLLIQKSRGVLI